MTGVEGMMAEDIHHWFGLTYCAYIVVPRSVAQSMPHEWQKTMVRLLEEMEEKCDQHKVSWGESTVKFRDDKGRFIHDPLANYQRGRRNVFNETP